MNREQQWTHYDESMYQMTSCTEKSELRRQSKRSEEICVEICTLFKELIIEPSKKYFKLQWWKWNGKSPTCKPHTPLSFNKTHFQQTSLETTEIFIGKYSFVLIEKKMIKSM